MIELKGLPISKGIAIGKAYVINISNIDLAIETISKNEIKKEIEIFHKALEKTKQNLQNLYVSRKELGLFFISLLDDISKNVISTITEQRLSAKSALYKEILRIENIFNFRTYIDPNWENKIFDMQQAIGMVIRVIEEIRKDVISKPHEKSIEEDFIMVGYNVDPTQLLESLQKLRLTGLALEKSGSASHSAVIAHQFSLPSVFAVKDLMKYVKEGVPIIVDGFEGKVIIDPSENEMRKYKAQQIKSQRITIELAENLSKPAQTLDGVLCKTMLNISTPSDVTERDRNVYDGVGLFRTEFMFMEKNAFLSEEEQFEAYLKVAEVFQDKPVIIRLLDLGGDKIFGETLEESKPALGWRSIRILFSKEKELFKQLRALIRANTYGNIKILVPMISSLEEVYKIKSYLAKVKKQLKEENYEFSENIELGIMVEIPSVAIMIKEFLKEVDFISIGTNDLTQYTLAVDRNNEIIAEYYEPLNPSILKMIYHCVNEANKMKKMVSICGEIASDTKYTRLLLALGLRNFSMAKEAVPFVKDIISHTHTYELKILLQKLKEAKTPNEVKKIVIEDLQEFQNRLSIHYL